MNNDDKPPKRVVLPNGLEIVDPSGSTGPIRNDTERAIKELAETIWPERKKQMSDALSDHGVYICKHCGIELPWGKFCDQTCYDKYKEEKDKLISRKSKK